MKRIVLTSLLVGFSFFAMSQISPINFKDCQYENFFGASEKSPEWNNKELTLVDYMNDKLANLNDIKKATGKIFIGILIYEDGKTCCQYFANQTNKKNIRPEEFKEVVNNMPNWKPGVQNGKPITFLYNLALNFKKGRIVED